MKVFGLTSTPHPSWGATSSQVRLVVAARSRKAAAQALRDAGLGWSDYAFGMYASETFNDAEREAATARPGVVLFASEDGRQGADDYRPVLN